MLNGEIFDTLLEARVLTERWRREYNSYRPHSSLRHKPPAPEAYEVENLFMKVVHRRGGSYCMPSMIQVLLYWYPKLEALVHKYIAMLTLHQWAITL